MSTYNMQLWEAARLYDEIDWFAGCHLLGQAC